MKRGHCKAPGLVGYNVLFLQRNRVAEKRLQVNQAVVIGRFLMQS